MVEGAKEGGVYGGRNVPRPPMIRTAGFLSAIVNKAMRLLPAFKKIRDRRKERGGRGEGVKERLEEGRRGETERRRGEKERWREDEGEDYGVKGSSVSGVSCNSRLSTIHRALENSGRSNFKLLAIKSMHRGVTRGIQTRI